MRRHGHDHEDPDDLVRPAPEILEDGIPATEELTAEQLPTLELVEGPILPIDRPLALDEWGVTPAEERAGLSLDRWLDLEEPDDTRPRVVDRIRQTFQPGADAIPSSMSRAPRSHCSTTASRTPSAPRKPRSGSRSSREV